MKPLTTLSDKLGVTVIKAVQYKPNRYLPNLDYLKTDNNEWWVYQVVIEVPRCDSSQSFYDWVHTERSDDDYTYSLVRKVEDKELTDLLEVIKC